MLSNTKGSQLSGYYPDYVVFDLETTGTSCYKDSVIEISAIKVVDHKIRDEFSSLVYPGRSIPYYASQVNGITDELVADAPEFEKVLKEFQRMLSDIREGKIDCVIVKDLSRFGRNYIESGRYIEKIFPMLGIRFIAITDGYDSINEDMHDAIIPKSEFDLVQEILLKDTRGD